MRALDVAADLATNLGGELIVCHVVDLARAATLSGGQAQLVPGCIEEVESEGKAIVDRALARAGNRVSATSRIAEGAPVEEIERLAAEIRPNFIVIGSHGRTGLNRAIMGSVAEGVVRAAPVPVMVVPTKHKQAAQG
jgi:nucleotide-binding universal stress UspA family protein